jgi:hypothetical protein
MKTLYGNRGSWIFWSKGAFVDVVPSIHKASDGTQTKYMCAYYGEGDPDFKPKNIPDEDFKTVWTAYASGDNRWQSLPLDPDAVRKAIEGIPDFKNSRIARHVGRFAIRAPVFWFASQMVALPAVAFITLSLFPPAALVTPVLYAAGGITVAVVGLIEVEDYNASRGRIEQVDDVRSPLYDPGTFGAADPELDFKKLLKVLKNIPPMSAKQGISCKAPDQILSELEHTGGIRSALSWQVPNITSGVKLSCNNLSGRSFILDRLGPGTKVRLSDDSGTTINNFNWDELSSYLKRDGTIISNIEKFQRASAPAPSTAANRSSGEVTGLKKYIEDNAAVQSQFELLSKALISKDMVVVLTDLPLNGDMVEETCSFIASKVSH